jgi:hypothetical protein
MQRTSGIVGLAGAEDNRGDRSTPGFTPSMNMPADAESSTPSKLAGWAENLLPCGQLVQRLQPLAATLGIEPAEETAWWAALFTKLLPQIESEPLLVVAICGGTNTGKSLLANALAGAELSRSIPEAARTRHPVASLPAGVAGRLDLAAFFPGFVPVAWQTEDDPLVDDPQNLLVWRERPVTGTPDDQFVLLDTPDIDGTLREHGTRAELIRDTSDVIVAVLTEQKYNDAVVRDFFRAATAAGKPLLVVVNMVDWPRQRELISGWVKTFEQAIGVAAEAVFAVPYDSAAAANGTIRFHPLPASAVEKTDPIAMLAAAGVGRLKIRALRGAVATVLDQEAGLPAWLSAIEVAGRNWQEAQRLLTTEVHVEIALPQPPAELVWDEIWAWLKPQRSSFDLTVSRAYTTLGRGLHWAAGRIGLLPPSARRREDFAVSERDVLKRALGTFIDRLEACCRTNRDVDRLFGPRIRGGDRAAWFADLERRQRELPLMSDDYRRQVRAELDRFAAGHPETVRWILTGLNVGAVVRPAVTVALWSAGAAVVPAAAATAGGLSTLVHHVGDVVVGTAASLAGEGAIGATVAGIKPLLDRLFAGWAVERGRILAETLQLVVLGDGLDEVERRAAAGARPELAELRQLLEQCRSRLLIADPDQPRQLPPTEES